MEKKDTWIIVAVIAILGIIFLGPALTGAAWFQTSQTALVKANSCNADEMCEMIRADISERAVIGKVLISDPSTAYNMITTLPDTSHLILTSGTMWGQSPTPVVQVQGKLFVSTLEANLEEENAYVCVNNLGQLYRSETPCV